MHKDLFSNSLQLEAQLLAEKYNINVIFRGTEAKTDGKTIWLPMLPDLIDILTEQVYRGYLAHEVGHCRYTDWQYHCQEQEKYRAQIDRWKKSKNISTPPEKIVKAQLMGVLSNIYEDPFVDGKMFEEFPGCKENLIQLNRYFEKVVPNFVQKDLSTWDKMLLTLYLCLYCWDLQKYPDLSPSKYGQDLSNFIQKLLKEEIADSRIAKSTKDNYILAERTFEKLKDFVDNLDQEEDQKSNEQQNLEQELDDKIKKDLQNFNEKYIENTIEFLNRDKGIKRLTDSVYLDLDQKEIYRPRPYTTEKDKIEFVQEQDYAQYNHILQNVYGATSFLRQKFLLLLKSKTNNRWQRNLFEGKLDNQRLSRIIKANYIGSNLPVYKQKKMGIKLKTAVSILIDASGSMYKEEAQTVLISLAEPLSQLNIPTEIISFTTKGQTLKKAMQETKKTKVELCKEFTRFDNLYFRIFKKFNENFQFTKGRLGTYETTGLTPIFEAIEFAGKRLYNFKQNEGYRKLLFVITDGLPNLLTAEYHFPMMLGMIAERSKQLERLGIKVCGIGLRSPFVQKVFPDYIVTEEADYDQLARLLTAKLSEHFINST